MSELHRAGKIRAIGVSNFSTEQMRAFRAVAPLNAAQPPYNLFEREAEEDVLPYCRDNAIVTLAYGSLCRGLLSGHVRPDRGFTGDDLRRSDPKFQPPRLEQFCGRSSGLTPLRARPTASASCISQFAGCSTSSRSASLCGERGILPSSTTSPMSRAGSLIHLRWRKSTALSLIASAIR